MAARLVGLGDRVATHRARCSPPGTARMTESLNVGVGVLILGLALWTVVAREAFATVVGYVVYGFVLTLVWVQLSAIDVALTEAAIGAGLPGGLLIGAASRLRDTEVTAHGERPGTLTRVVAAIA